MSAFNQVSDVFLNFETRNFWFEMFFCHQLVCIIFGLEKKCMVGVRQIKYRAYVQVIVDVCRAQCCKMSSASRQMED